MEWSIFLSRMRAAMLVLGFLLSVVGLSMAQSAKNEDSMLTATVTSDRTDYSLAGDMCLDVRVTNAGESPLTVFGELMWGYLGGLVLRVTDTSNREVPAKGLDDAMVPPLTLQDRNSFVVLSPHHYLGTTRCDHLGELVDKPGAYLIQVVYISPVAPGFGQGPHFWSREKPPVWSNNGAVRAPSWGESMRRSTLFVLIIVGSTMLAAQASVRIKEWHSTSAGGEVTLKLSLLHPKMGKGVTVLTFYSADDAVVSTAEGARLLARALDEMPSLGYDPRKVAMITVSLERTEYREGVDVRSPNLGKGNRVFV